MMTSLQSTFQQIYHFISKHSTILPITCLAFLLTNYFSVTQISSRYMAHCGQMKRPTYTSAL